MKLDLFCFSDGYLLLQFLHANLLDMNMSNLVVNLFTRFVAARNQDLERNKRLTNKTVV
jgi:hypothetical protein